MTFAEQLKPSVGALKAAKKCMLALPCGDLPKSNPVPIIERWAAHIDREAVKPAVAELVAALTELVETYHKESFIACITPGARKDATKKNGAQKYFDMWDEARDLIAKHST